MHDISVLPGYLFKAQPVNVPSVNMNSMFQRVLQQTRPQTLNCVNALNHLKALMSIYRNAKLHRAWHRDNKLCGTVVQLADESMYLRNILVISTIIRVDI